MRVCPYCGHPLDEGLDRCNKCGAFVTVKSEKGGIRCSKCGGVLKGTEARCPWCGFPCIQGLVDEDSEAYKVLKAFENSLREFIRKELSRIDAGWWETRVPEDVRKEANRRKIRDERLYPWNVQRDLHPIYYVNFSDYAKVITLDINWNQVFKKVFKDKGFITTKLRELEPIRSAIAHGRDISSKDLQKLKLYTEEIMACMITSLKISEMEASLLRAVTAKVGINHGILRVSYLDYESGILQMEFEKGGVGDVIKPRPTHELVKFKPEIRFQVEEEINHFLRVIASSSALQILKIANLSEVIEKVGRVIYSIFPQSIQEQMQTMPSESLLSLSLDDRVLGLPWELAYDGSEYLCAKFGVGRVIYSDIAFPVRRKVAEETRIMLISNPDGSLPHDDEIAATLKNKLEEFGAVVDHFSSSCSDSRFCPFKRNVLKALGSGLYDIVYYSGHGKYDPINPEKSSITVADGEISAIEISEVLSRSLELGKYPPILFYANTCQAGAQRSWDEKAYKSQVLGFPAVFVKQNTAYIGALWNASFKPTEITGSDKLALKFFEELLGKEQPLGLALRNAKLSIKSEDNVTCDWANFILYGDPSITFKIQ